LLSLNTNIPTAYFSQIEIKKSKFISYIYPFTHQDNLKQIINQLQKEHIKARHFVYACRYFNEHLQIVESFSDDGEPKNSSAIPMLNVLRGNNIINVAIVCVRYFGGTKLGVGGLVRAYTSSVKEIIKQSLENQYLQEYRECITFDFCVSFSNLSIIEYNITKYNLSIITKDFLNDGVNIIVSGIREDIDIFKNEKKLLFRS
jgi:uncharacterized YigZ family protein